jgi:hypothetical protein
MATRTYEPIATTTVSGTSTGTITFSSISGTYTDLRLVAQAQVSDGYCLLRVNGDSGTNYSNTRLTGNGSSASSSRSSSDAQWFINVEGANLNSNFTVDFMNYSNATTYKTKLSRISRAADSVVQDVSLWRNTSAITSISVIVPAANNWVAGSTFTLYGIKAA